MIFLIIYLIIGIVLSFTGMHLLKLTDPEKYERIQEENLVLMVFSIQAIFWLFLLIYTILEQLYHKIRG